MESIGNQNSLTAIGYDPAQADKAAHIGKSLFSHRLFLIICTIWKFARFNCLPTKIKANSQYIDRRKARACQLRESLTALGVTFIKLGQFLSMRPDILPVELTEELSLLQDQVPPFPFAQVKAIVERELDAKLDQLFQSFDLTPIASASIGQVHRGILKDGKAVAIKVQRPDIANLIYQDLALMKLFAHTAQILHLKGEWQDWLELIDQFGYSLFAEMNYLQEGRHADRLRKALRNFPTILIPRIIWRYSSPKVLTEELCEGAKIDNLGMALSAGFDLKRLVRQLVEAYLEQVFVHGFFHADPHSGNFAITPDGQASYLRFWYG